MPDTILLYLLKLLHKVGNWLSTQLLGYNPTILLKLLHKVGNWLSPQLLELESDDKLINEELVILTV